MKLGISINMGNYESFRIDSSEHENKADCIKELLELIKDLQKLTEYRKSNMKFWFDLLNNWLKDVEK